MRRRAVGRKGGAPSSTAGLGAGSGGGGAPHLAGGATAGAFYCSACAEMVTSQVCARFQFSPRGHARTRRRCPSLRPKGSCMLVCGMGSAHNVSRPVGRGRRGRSTSAAPCTASASSCVARLVRKPGQAGWVGREGALKRIHNIAHAFLFFAFLLLFIACPCVWAPRRGARRRPWQSTPARVPPNAAALCRRYARASRLRVGRARRRLQLCRGRSKRLHAPLHPRGTCDTIASMTPCHVFESLRVSSLAGRRCGGAR